jgi:hypothetical protein
MAVLFFGGIKLKCLDKEAKETLNRLVSMTTDGYAKIDNSDFMAVIIEKLPDNSVSVAHYGKLNGDLMADPEMVFWLNDDEWYPCYYLNHYAFVEQNAVQFQDGKPSAIKRELQKDMVDFANGWLRNIKEQQDL